MELILVSIDWKLRRRKNHSVSKAASTFQSVIILAIILASTVGGWWIFSSNQSGQTSIDDVPWPTKGWLTSTPEAQDMNGTKLDEMMEYIDENDIPIDSVIVVRNGNIVLEEYPLPGSAYIHNIASCTKSFTSALVGIAIREGYIESIDQKVIDFFPDKVISNMDSRKQDMTIEHLLTMTPGFEWDHDVDDPESDYYKIRASDDWTQYTLDRPMADNPGEEWVYCTGGSNLLSAIIERATGCSTLDFAWEFLFGPLNMSNVGLFWYQAPEGVYNGAGGMHLRPRDMAKFGYLYLNNGTWDGEQILPAEYVARSTEASFSFGENTGYGYQWWTYSMGVYAAEGLYGQKIYVVPELDMVVVFNADLREGPDLERLLLYRFIIPACNEYVLLQETYSEYGFSFDYPIGMTKRENGYIEESISESSGTVQFRSDLPFEIINVIWDTAESAPELEGVLDDLFDMVEGQGVRINDSGSLEASMKDEHEMVYQCVNLTEQGFQMTAVVGSWYCDEVNRVYVFNYVTLPEFVTQHDLLREFHRHLDSLVCH